MNKMDTNKNKKKPRKINYYNPVKGFSKGTKQGIIVCSVLLAILIGLTTFSYVLPGTPKAVCAGSAGLPSERAKISVPSGPNVRFPPGCADPRNLAQNPWMATDGHLAEFPKDAFNIAVHVRTGEAAWSELTLPIPAFTWVVGDRRPKPGP